MTSLVVLPAEYGYVLFAASTTFFVNTLHGFLTGKARRASGIKYPTSFASTEQAEKDVAAFKFNCAQRAHANFTENLTPFLGALLISGLKYPVAAAGAGLVWTTARVLFAIGYVSKGPQGRMVGSTVGTLTDLTLKVTAAYTALGFAMGW
ncbi:hypothetical protein QBC43DRAFT_86076 [Cladorrhinum sp. PSN259]|nr:hypothetical protein QBC43DRAFT_86076 [Cladorrhinum sp. PSN259]